LRRGGKTSATENPCGIEQTSSKTGETITSLHSVIVCVAATKHLRQKIPAGYCSTQKYLHKSKLGRHFCFEQSLEASFLSLLFARTAP
jgi:hypothetical protein